MDNKQIRNFAIKFDELNENNKKFLIAILQALKFAESTSEQNAVVSKENKILSKGSTSQS